MINAALIAFMVKDKLNEIVSGKIPDGFIVKEKTENKIVLCPGDGGQLIEGVDIKSFNAVIPYNGIEIIITNER